MKLWGQGKVWLVIATVGLAACAPQTAQDTAPSSTPAIAASTTEVEGSVGLTPSSAASVAANVSTPEPSTSTLPLLFLPGPRLDNPAGEYGWTGALGKAGGMHTDEGSSSDDYRQTQLMFAVENDCFAAGGDPVPMTVAGLDGLYVEPYEFSVLPEDNEWPYSSRTFSPPRGGETQEAYALPIDDRTLCVYLTWDPATTEEELAEGRQIVESIRGQPYGEDGIRINLTVPAGWDTG